MMIETKSTRYLQANDWERLEFEKAIMPIFAPAAYGEQALVRVRF